MTNTMHPGQNCEPFDETNTRSILENLRRRLAHQQRRQALMGSTGTPPEISIEIEDLQTKIAELEAGLRDKGTLVETLQIDEPRAETDRPRAFPHYQRRQQEVVRLQPSPSNQSISIPVLVLFNLVTILLAITTNIATSALPTSWEPYLWMAWPSVIVFALITIALAIRQTQRGSSASMESSMDDERYRRRLLRKVRQYWIKEGLEQSVHGAALLALELEYLPGAIEHPRDMVVPRGGEKQKLPPGTRVTTIFDDQGGDLLILGAPGAGKTTMLLELAQNLLDRAERDAGHPIPVVLSLLRWSETLSLSEPHHRRQFFNKVGQIFLPFARPSREKGPAPFVRWVVNELDEFYGIPQQVGGALVDSNELLLLLDGLDEVQQEHREKCIGEINAFRREHSLTSMAISCRVADYETLRTRLQLDSAVVIHPLTGVQIDNYLNRAGEPVSALREAIQHDRGLRELAELPLLLRLMTLAYQGSADAPLKRVTTSKDTLHRVFADYISRMIGQPRSKMPYPARQVQRWLAWLAYGMIAHNQSVFYLEDLQLTWLTTALQRRFYNATVSILTMLLGSTFGIFVDGLSSGVFELYTGAGMDGLRSGAWLGLGGGAFAGLVVSLLVINQPASTAEKLAWSWLWLRAKIRAILLASTILGLVGGGVFGRSAGFTGILYLGLVGTLFLVLAIGFYSVGNSRTKLRIEPNQGIWRSLRTAVEASLILGLLFGLVGLLSGSLLSVFDISATASYRTGWAVALGVSSCIALVWLLGELGGVSVIQHFALRIILYSSGNIPLRYVQFLHRSANHNLLREVGGGYMFIHRLLMEYFASLDTIRPGIALSTYAWALVQRGQTYWQLGHPEEALVDLNQALTRDPNSVEALTNRGGTYRSMGHYEEALADLNQALTRDPNSIDALTTRGWIYVSMGRYKEALADLNQALALDPKFVVALNGRGGTYTVMGHYEEALADLNQALALDSNSVEALTNRGWTYRSMGCYEEALVDLNQALALDPKFVVALTNRGGTYMWMGRYEEALADLNQALALDPKFVVALTNRGWTHVRMGCYEEVLADFDQAVTPESEDWNLYSRALMYRFLGRDDEANADLVAAIERAQRQYVQYPEASRIAYNLALYFLADGQYKEAEQQYQRTQPPTTLYLHEPIHDLEGFLALFPQHKFAQTMLEQLRGMKSQADLP